jgi:hypothetical protein
VSLEEKIKNLKLGIELEYNTQINLEEIKNCSIISIIDKLNDLFKDNKKILIKREVDVEIEDFNKLLGTLEKEKEVKNKRSLGIEINYGPFRYEEKEKALKEIKNVIKTIEKNYKLHLVGKKYRKSLSACHIHLDYSDLYNIDPKLPLFLSYFVLNNENNLFLTYVSKRKVNKNSKKVLKKLKEKKDVKKVYEIRKELIYNHSLFGIATCSFSQIDSKVLYNVKYDTLEIRTFRSTKNMIELNNYINFTIDLIKYYYENKDKELEELSNWKNFLKWKVNRFFKDYNYLI